MATLSSPTLQNLITSVRFRLKQRDPNNSTWTNAELTEYLNTAIEIYFQECIEANEGYFTTQTDLNIVANSETVALPVDCYQVKNLYKAVTNGYICLSYRNNTTEGYSTQGGTSSDAYLPEYYFQGTNILLHPIPNFSQTAGLRLEYIQLPTEFVWNGDSLTSQIAPIFKELLIDYAVYMAKWTESLVTGGQTYAPAQSQLDRTYTLFKNTIARRSKNATFVNSFAPEFDVL